MSNTIIELSEANNTRAQRLLQEKVSKMSASLQEAATKGLLKYADGFYYKAFALPIGASGLQDILLNDDSQKDGYCSISKQKINPGCAFMADRMTVGAYSVATSSLAGNDEGTVSYSPISALTAIPALQNAEIEFTVNGVRQFMAPLTAFNQETIRGNSAKEGINFSAPVFINDEQLLQFRLHLPQGKSIDATLSAFLKVTIFGAECRISQ